MFSIHENNSLSLINYEVPSQKILKNILILHERVYQHAISFYV